MSENTFEAEQKSSITKKTSALLPTAEELSVLSNMEKVGFRLADRMNRGAWKRFWTFCQRHIGSLWIKIATYNLMNVFGLENIEQTDTGKPLN